MSKFDWKDGLILGAMGLGVVAWDSFRSYKSLAFDIPEYRVSDVNFSENRAKFTMWFRIVNPLLLGVTIYRLSGRVLLDGHVIGTVDHSYKYYLSGKHTHIIPVTVNVNIHDLGYNALKVFTGDYGKAMLEFVGTLSVGRGGLVSIPVEIGMTIEELV